MKHLSNSITPFLTFRHIFMSEIKKCPKTREIYRASIIALYYLNYVLLPKLNQNKQTNKPDQKKKKNLSRKMFVLIQTLKVVHHWEKIMVERTWDKCSDCIHSNETERQMLIHSSHFFLFSWGQLLIEYYHSYFGGSLLLNWIWKPLTDMFSESCPLHL